MRAFPVTRKPEHGHDGPMTTPAPETTSPRAPRGVAQADPASAAEGVFSRGERERMRSGRPHGRAAADGISVADVARTRSMLEPHIVRTPVLSAKASFPQRVHLKCENLQVTDSFKVRGAISGLLSYRESRPHVWDHIQRHGVVTCSSGNFAQGLAHATARLGIDYAVLVPEAISDVKVAQILRHNPAAAIYTLSRERWRSVMEESSYPDLPAFFLSSETDHYVSLGLATIALEVLEDLPAVDAVLVPYGGGNLSYSLATCLQAAGTGVPVFAVEVSTGAPLTASMRAGRPVTAPYRPSFVDGIGGDFVIPAQFERVRNLLAGVLTVTPEEVALALSALLFEDKLLCEGAGAAAYAAAVKYAPAHDWLQPCAVLSGGVIDRSVVHQAVWGTEEIALPRPHRQTPQQRTYHHAGY